MTALNLRNESLGALDLPLPTFVPRRYRPGDLGTWSGHLCFANDLIAEVQPALLVELGTHWGESYFGFCQSVLENGVSCLCYAVDNWVGEAHAGLYGEEVFEDVRQYNETNYKAFSYLLRTTFDDALRQFSDETIDLLHIDGLHTFAAVTRDYRNWLSKVKPGGIILFHDIAVRHVDFGVWRLWNEIEAEFPKTFAFHHWWGLGVLRKPGGDTQRPALLDLLFDSPLATKEAIRRHYTLCTFYLEHTLRPPEKTIAPAVSTNTRAQVLLLRADGHSEETSLTRDVEFGRWSTLVFDFTQGIGEGPVRVDPADCPCVIEISEITVFSKQSEQVLWSARDFVALRELKVGGTASILPCDGKYSVFSYGHHPQLQLPILGIDRQPLRIEVSLRVHRTLDTVLQILDAQTRKMESAQAEIDLRSGLEAELEVLRDSPLQREVDILRSALESERAVRIAMQQSRSWRMTGPFRSFMQLFRK